MTTAHTQLNRPPQHEIMDDQQQTTNRSLFARLKCAGRRLPKRLTPALLAAAAVLTPLQFAKAIDIPVADEAEYAQLLDAIRAAEYTRQSYLEDNANPRAIATVAALWAFAERNPLATPEQLAAFAQTFDQQLAEAVPGDPTLIRFGAVMIALNSSRIESTGELTGTDTRVGKRAMELLGMNLPGLNGYEQSRQRMTRFDLSAVRRLIHRTETADALTGALAGVDPSGNRVHGLAQVTANYLTGLGYSPMLGQIDPDQSAVNAGLENLPNFAEFEIIRSTPDGHTNIEAEVFAQMLQVEDSTRNRLDQIGIAQVQPNFALDTVAIYSAATDPDNPDHEQAVQMLEGQLQERINQIRETSDERAAIFARTILLRQSEFAEIQSVATSARSFAGIQLQANNTVSDLEQGLQIAGSAFALGAAAASGNPFEAGAALTDLVGGSLGLGGLFGGSSGPSVEQQIFEQIVELREQVEDVRVQMNARFDVVDAKLDIVFDTMVTGFNALGNQIGDLQSSVDDLNAEMAAARSSLDRIETALFGFAEDVLLIGLSNETDLVLNYRNNTGKDLKYSNASPSYITSASNFFTFGTTIAKNNSFAGPTTPLLTLNNAHELLEDQPIARWINDLRHVPHGLVTSDGSPVTGPIQSGRVPAPAPWAQAAAAYAQLVRENPWYFAVQYQNQLADSGSATQLDQLISDGNRIVGLANATRAHADLFDGILTKAESEALQMNDAITGSMLSTLASKGLANANGFLDPWGHYTQPVAHIAPRFTDRLDVVQGSGSTPFNGNFPDTGNWQFRGYEMLISNNLTDTLNQYSREELAQINAMLELIWPDELRYFERLFRSGTPSHTINPVYAGTKRSPSIYPASPWSVKRSVHLRAEWQSGGTWLPLDGASFSTKVTLLNRAEVNLFNAMQSGDIIGTTLSSGTLNISGASRNTRLVVTSDLTESTYGLVTWWFYVPVKQELKNFRDDIRNAVLSEFSDNHSTVSEVSSQIKNTLALLDAYLTLGASEALNQSEVIRSAIRGVPSEAGLGFRADDFLTLILLDEQQDDGEIGSSPVVSIPEFEDHFLNRINALRAEVGVVRTTEAVSFPYVEFVLSELRELRDNAFRLAIDDTYAASGAISIDAASGLLANDIGQPGRIDDQELSVDLDFFYSSEHQPPSHGSVTVNADGSFHYTPDPGFQGVDSFNYRLTARVIDSQNPAGNPFVISNPATVVLRIGQSSCPADVTGSGKVDLDDLNIVLMNFGQTTSIGDTNGDGVVDLDDLNAVLTAFGTSCS